MPNPSPHAAQEPLKVGDLVRWRSDRDPKRDLYGEVEHRDTSHIRVRWEDGGIGLLYFDGHAADARRLERIPR